MKCVFCGGEIKKMLVTFSNEVKSKFFLVEHVPAGDCERCGEKTYSPDVTDELLKFAKDKFDELVKNILAYFSAGKLRETSFFHFAAVSDALLRCQRSITDCFSRHEATNPPSMVEYALCGH